MTVRNATRSDHPAIVEVFLGCWRGTYAAVLPPDLIGSMTDQRARTLWHDVIESAAPGEIVVAEVAGHAGLAGVLRWHAEAGGSPGWIDSLYVAPSAQRRGVGSALIEHAVRAIGAAAAIHLWAFAANAPSIAFYARHGWQPDGEVRVTPEFGEPEIRLTRRLEPRASTEPAPGPSERPGRAAPAAAEGALQGAVERLVAEAPGEAPGPAGVAAALRTESLDVRAVAGSRTVADSPPGVQPMTARTAHDIASVTKLVTTTAVMRLVSDRQLGLDDPVRRFLPTFTSVDKDRVTVRHLLLHRGGLAEWWPLYVADARDPDGVLDRLPLQYSVGAGRWYSDLGFILLGRIVATVTASPLDAAVAELVTGPLGMTETRFARPVDDDVAMSAYDDRVERTMLDTDAPYPTPFAGRDFGAWREEPIIGDVNDGNAFHAYHGVAGHAGLFSTLDDMLGLADGLGRAVEGDDLVDPAVAEQFYAPGPDEGQSLGFRRYEIAIDRVPATMLGHTGFVGCAVGFVPGRGVSVAMASNRLVTSGTPAATDDLWSDVLTAAAEEIAP